jgi:DTW domain-containing protein YfiP
MVMPQTEDEPETECDDDVGVSEMNMVRTTGVSRCGRCWLRWYNCYCGQYLNQRQSYYETRWREIAKEYGVDIEIVMFYHAAELGRSANTAHIFEHLCQSITKVIFYGDQEKEEELIQRIIAASVGKTARPEHTCLLYPCNEAISLNQWIDRRFQSEDANHAKNIGTIACSSEKESPRPLVRMIVLDGTYPRAKHMMKFFKAYKKEFRLDASRSLDFVQLDLDLDKGLRSAVAGVMYQPAKDKICSYQATVMAIRQLLYIIDRRHNKSNEPSSLKTSSGGALCKELDDDLEQWIIYILKHKIKYGKPTPRKSLTDVDNQLPEHLQKILVS